MSIYSRLAKYKKRAAESKYNNDWRTHRYEKHHVPDRPRYRDGLMFLDSLSIGDECGPAHDIIRLDHTGWYVDGYQDDTLRGEVMRLRLSRGTYYIPITICTGWDGVTYYLADAILVPRGSDEDAHEEAKREAAREADENARIEAEHSREDWEKDQADQMTEEARDEIHALNKEALAIIQQVKGQTFPPAICQAVRDRISGILSERRKLFQRIHTLATAPWEIVNNY